MPEAILTLNAGSSSIKFALYECPAGARRHHGDLRVTTRVAGCIEPVHLARNHEECRAAERFDLGHFRFA